MKQPHRHQWWHFVRCGIFAFSCLAATQTYAETYYVVIAGLGGEPDYEQRFTAAAKQLDKTFKASGPTAHTFLLTGDQSTFSHLKEVLQSVAGTVKPEDDFVLILIGHGSFDGTTYKFNLPGPDISATEIADQCNRIRARRQLIVDTTSASGGAIPALQRQGRAIITATKSGTEKNATVFARYWVEAFEDSSADTDKSDSISALEAFTYATKKTAGFYDSQKRLATEHAVFVDTLNGAPVREPDRDEGALLSNLTLLRIGATQQAANNPARLALLQKKEELEQNIDILKYQKAAMDPGEYKQQLTALLLELAHTQQEMDK
ncbi:hypothetical protein [Edaphobacter sp. 12200R-103]|jgi:hypothetical protein|uniref:hypothetical protein n=1 Tax=Edaphobacter sp. 12200R-103 TaxID=2703788 RepID=UPI00138C4B74|nr:hypothetical protein [Edaphobacter sp. 12200R-103]QHS50690.1 hypothetical protein GWR55_02220 [Edaphobacter sp. 12200R-103]